MAVDYCASRGIPYEDFLDWSDLSRSTALAWQARERERCGGCSTVPSDWWAREDDGTPILDAAGNPVPAFPPLFQVHGEVCPGCAAMDAARKQENAKRPGWRLFFRRNT